MVPGARAIEVTTVCGDIIFKIASQPRFYPSTSGICYGGNIASSIEKQKNDVQVSILSLSLDYKKQN
jgi:hypothetical protein